MLPPGVELLPQPLTGPGRHPVVYVHNEITRIEAPGVPPFAYDEWLTWIPALRLANGTKCATEDGLVVNLGALAFMPKLLLNQQLPVDVGVNFYGFNKYLSSVEAEPSGWRVFDVGQPATATPFYRAKFGAEKPLSAQGAANLTRLRAILPGAVVGQMRDTKTLVWSGLEFREENPTALEGMSVAIENATFGHQQLEVGSIEDSVFGAYRLRVKFRGSIPAPCTVR